MRLNIKEVEERIDDMTEMEAKDLLKDIAEETLDTEDSMSFMEWLYDMFSLGNF